MQAVKFIDYKGTNILIMDLSNIKDKIVLSKYIDDIICTVQSTDKYNSIFGLLDLTNIAFNKSTISFLKKLSRNNGPYMKYVAFVGLNPILSIAFNMFFNLTNRSNHKAIKSRSKALSWLSSH
jgi:hypothetical protein